jgi:hypothetical protein
MLTFEEWEAKYCEGHNSRTYHEERYDSWHARDGEVAVLERIIHQQNEERQKIIEEAFKNDLPAAEKVARAVLAESEWWAKFGGQPCTESDMTTMMDRLAVNRQAAGGSNGK